MVEGLSEKQKTSVISVAHARLRVSSLSLYFYYSIYFIYLGAVCFTSFVHEFAHQGAENYTSFTKLAHLLQNIAHLTQKSSHHLHTLIPVKAPAHERVICSGCVGCLMHIMNCALHMNWFHHELPCGMNCPARTLWCLQRYL